MPTDPALLERLQRLWSEPPPDDPPALPPVETFTDDTESPELILDFAPERRGIPTWCRYASHRQGWRSIFGAVVCSTCHSPATPGLVAEWLTFEN